MKYVSTLLIISGLFLAHSGHANEETDKLFQDGTAALDAGRPTQAIANFEALADRGTVDAYSSYDRGLAYAMRVRIGGEVAGDLGQAAASFEEARLLTNDPSLRRDATTALSVIRTEVARRKARNGESIDIDPGVSAIRVASRLLSENTWFYVAMASSLLIAIGLFVRSQSASRRVRVTGITAASLACVGLLVCAPLAYQCRSDRLYFREAVVVVPSARLSDSRGIALPGASVLPEAARVQILDVDPAAFSHIRFGTIEAWVPRASLRALATVD